MKRYEIIDGLRGYFLVFMLINHLVFVGGYWMLFINHNQLAFVEDAQGFVFLSGLLVGMVYSRKMAKKGYEQACQQIWDRAFEIYRYAIGIVMVVLAAQIVLPDAYRIWHDWLGYTTFDDPLRLAAIGTLLFQPTFMDILPQYVIYMIFAPPIIWLCMRGKWAYVAVASLILWMAGQLGLQRAATDFVNGWVLGGDDQGIRVSFNLFGWQIVFFSGLVAGVLTANRTIDWTTIFRPEATLIPKLCLMVCLFFLPLRIASAHELLPQIVLDKFATMEIRSDFGPVYLLNFPAVAFGLVWLLIAGPRHSNIYVRRVAAGLTWLFSLSFLRLLGRHSLHVYVWHVIIVYAVFYIDQQTPEFSQVTKTLIALLSIVLLSIPALWRERDRLIGGPPPKFANG
ncbi:MAG: OpgC domain-containing protein [Rhizobiaceae bacterium]|nr:OpgC domain-containing protein [Rhizobiaceae bacterium]